MDYADRGVVFLEIAARLDTQERAIAELRKHVASVPDLPQTLDRNHSTPSNSSPEEAGKVLEAAKARPALDPAIVEAALLHWKHCGCQHCQPNKALRAHLQQILAQDAK